MDVQNLSAANACTAGQAFSRGLFGMSGLRFGSLAEIEKVDNGQLPNVFLTGGELPAPVDYRDG